MARLTAWRLNAWLWFIRVPILGYIGYECVTDGVTPIRVAIFGLVVVGILLRRALWLPTSKSWQG